MNEIDPISSCRIYMNIFGDLETKLLLGYCWPNNASNFEYVLGGNNEIQKKGVFLHFCLQNPQKVNRIDSESSCDNVLSESKPKKGVHFFY